MSESTATLTRALGKSIRPQILGKFRQGDIRHCFADIAKAEQLLGWKPTRTFSKGVPKLVEWVQSQREARDEIDSAWSELQQRGLLS